MTGETRRLEETLVTDHAEVGSLVPVLFLVEDDGIPIRESETLSLAVPVTSSNLFHSPISRVLTHVLPHSSHSKTFPSPCTVMCCRRSELVAKDLSHLVQGNGLIFL